MSIRHTVKSIVEGMPHIVTGGVPPVRAGEERLASRKLEVDDVPTIILQSETFQPDGAIPRKCSAEGGNQNPVLRWADVPPETRSLVLMVEDPDAPTPDPFVHWLVWGIPSTQATLTGPQENIREGKNSMLKNGWTGCAPPKGDTAHRYFFQLFALDVPVELAAGSGRGALLEAMTAHVVGYGELRGTYEIPK